MATIRDMDSGRIVDVNDDGRRLTFEMDGDVDHIDGCDCPCGTASVGVTFDKAELLALLGGGK
jgi:hypothetical protein